MGHDPEKRTMLIFSLLDRTSLVNERFIMWHKNTIFLQEKAGSPKQARKPHLACSDSQSQHRIWFILLTCRIKAS